jgi:hypothetical protein
MAIGALGGEEGGWQLCHPWRAPVSHEETSKGGTVAAKMLPINNPFIPTPLQFHRTSCTFSRAQPLAARAGD